MTALCFSFLYLHHFLCPSPPLANLPFLFHVPYEVLLTPYSFALSIILWLFTPSISFPSITSEAGASIYSVSPEAVKEMPDLDPNLRSAGTLAIMRILDHESYFWCETVYGAFSEITVRKWQKSSPQHDLQINFYDQQSKAHFIIIPDPLGLRSF